MISSPLFIPAGGIMHVMSKLVPESYFDPQTTDNLDLGLGGLLDSLRKPSKLTATLKRRALKKKAGGKSTLDEARPAAEVFKRR
jgi:hypothetical protein